MLKRVAMKYVFFLLFIQGFAWAEDRAANHDLRNDRAIFKILKVSKKLTYSLKSSSSGQFNYQMIKGKKIVKSQKVDPVDAQVMDDQFVDKFITFKYMMKSREGAKCNHVYKLNLRTEELTICAGEKAKITGIESLLKKFTKLVF